MDVSVDTFVAHTLMPVGIPDVMSTLLSSTAGISRPGNAATEHETYIPMAQPIPIDSMNHLGRKDSHSFGDFEPGAPCYTLTKGHSHAVAQPISIHPHCIGRSPEAGPQGKEYLLDGSAYCMDSRGQPQAVAQPIAIQDTRPIEKAQNGRGWNDDGTAYTVDTHATQGVAQPIAFHATQDPISGSVSPALGSNMYAGVAQPIEPIRYGEHQQDTLHHESGILSTLPAGSKDNTSHYTNTVVGMAVRRLTPVEGERLQGFPDNYTEIPWRGKAETPDGPRYKALGNSMAVPVMKWIGERINQVNRD
ncbi:MAG: DNA cytosine methyltransferase [Burkholderiaceae bacterium]